MIDINFGDVVSARDATVDMTNELPKLPEPQSEISSRGNALWEYREEGTINGIPVDAGDCGLMIDKEELLNVAFELQRIPRSLVVYISPEHEEGKRQYDKLLDMVAHGKVVIVDEMKQYDQSKGCFVVWTVYEEVQYKLHKRYEYLRSEGGDK